MSQKRNCLSEPNCIFSESAWNHWQKRQDDVPELDVLVIDGLAIVNILKASASLNFTDNADLVFYPYIREHLESGYSLVYVHIQYFKDWRENDIHRRVQGQNKVPQNWHSFLKDDDNTKERLCFISCAQQNFEEKLVVATKVRMICVILYAMMFQVKQHVHMKRLTLESWFKYLMPWNTDLNETWFEQLILMFLSWLFHNSMTSRQTNQGNLGRALGIERAHTLPVLHAFAGWNTVFFLQEKKKKSVAWETWMAFENLTLAFWIMINQPTSQNMDLIMSLVEWYVVLTFDNTNSPDGVNKARKQLFPQKG